MGERRGVYRVLVGKPEGKRPLWRTKVWRYGLDLTGSVKGQAAVTREYGNEPSGSIKVGNFLIS
jgi:hypothetical protein